MSVAVNYWWFNHGKYFDQDAGHEIIWAPIEEHGIDYVHWRNFDGVQKGDIVFHQAQGKLRAISQARADTKRAHYPGEPWAGMGRLLKTDYTPIYEMRYDELDEDVIDRLVAQKGGPLAKNKRAKQGRLFPVDGEIAKDLLAAFGRKQEQRLEDSESTKRRRMEKGKPSSSYQTPQNNASLARRFLTKTTSRQVPTPSFKMPNDRQNECYKTLSRNG